MVDTMPQYHLYLLQCSFDRIDCALQELSQIVINHDVIVLMDDSIFALQHPSIHQFKQIKVLSDDAHLIYPYTTVDSSVIPQVIDYSMLSDLIVHSTKTHCWR